MTNDPFWPNGHLAELIELLRSEPSAEALAEKTKRLVERSADEVVAFQLDDVPRSLGREMGERAGFEARLAGRWGSALDLFDLFVLRARELGAELNAEHRPRAAAEQNHKFEALTRLQGRGVQIGREISVLLRAGFSTAALARWRTLFEVWVVFALIADGDDELANRYLCHDAVEAMKGQEDHERNWEALGFARPDTDPTERQTLRGELAAEFGTQFLKPYGWAAPLFDDKAPRLGDLRDRAMLGHWAGHYRMASHGTHANPTGIVWSVQDGGHADVIWVDASNAGLVEPAQCSLIALANLSVGLLQFAVDDLIDSDDVLFRRTQALVFQQATLALMDAAIGQFVEIAAVQDAEEVALEALIDTALSRLGDSSLMTGGELAELLDVAREDVDEALDAAVARGRLSAETRYFLTSVDGTEPR